MLAIHIPDPALYTLAVILSVAWMWLLYQFLILGTTVAVDEGLPTWVLYISMVITTIIATTMLLNALHWMLT